MFHSSRAIPIAVAALFLVPLVPVGSASGACGGDPCAELALFPHPDGILTTLVGDDAASAQAGLVASTRPLPFALTIAKGASFRIHVSSPTPTNTPVVGSVTVFAQEIGGARHVLAQRTYAPTNATLPAGPHTPIVRAIEATIHDTLASVEPGAASFLVDEAHDRACATPTTPGALVCGATSGAPALGSYRPCDPADPGQTVPRAVWTVGQTVDRELRDRTGQGACGHHAWNETAPFTATADDVQRAFVQAIQAPLGEIGNTLGSATNGSGPGGENWGDIALNATPPSWLPQDATSFTLPPGLALGFEVALSTTTRTPFGVPSGAPVIVAYGSANSPTRLIANVATPLPFGALTGPTPTIGEGRHEGFLADPFQIDDYGFEAPDGSVIEIRANGMLTRTNFTLLSPEGDMSAGGRIDAPAEPGRWTLRVSRSDRGESGPINRLEYSFDLQFRQAPAPEADDGRNVTEGSYAGDLGVGDDVDTYTFHAWQRQHFTLTLAHATTADLDLDVASGAWDIQRTDTPDGATYAARAQATGTLEVRVTRAWGESAYSLALDLAEEDDLSTVPVFADIWQDTQGQLRSEISGRDGRVVFGISDGEETTILSMSHAGDNETLRTELTTGDIGRVAFTQAALAYRDVSTGESALVLDDGAMVDPLIAEPIQFAFGPDAAYAIVREGNTDRLVRFNEDRTATALTLPIEPTDDLLLTPDARILILSKGKAYTVDLPAEQITRSPAYDGIEAFDEAGRGFRVLNRTLIERFDPSTGSGTIVARTDRIIAELVATGPYLYAMLADGGEDWLAYAQLPSGAPGFAGFEPAFHPPTAPDLLVTRVDDISLGPAITSSLTLADAHEIRLTIANRGGSASAAFRVALDSSGLPGGDERSVVVGPLDAGATTTVVIPWNFTRSVGDSTIRYSLDADRRVVESSEWNNAGSIESEAFVGGDRAACEMALRAIGVPSQTATAICRIR